MRFLLDQNLSFRIARSLVRTGHDAVHVTDVGLDDTDDQTIFNWAADQRRSVITADADFGEMLALADATAPSVIHLRSADHLSTDEQARLLTQAIARIGDDLEAGAIASIRPDRIRIRPLPIGRDNNGD